MAKYFNGRNASSINVTIRVTESGLFLDSEENTSFWNYSDLKFERFSSTYIKYHHASGASIQLNEAEFVEVKYSLPKKLQGQKERFKIWHYAAAIIFIMVSIHFSLNPITKFLAHYITPEMESSLVSQIIPVLKKGNLATDKQQLIIHAALKNLGEDAEEYGIYIVDMKEANAFALPGKNIVFTNSIFKFFNNQEEFIAVFAHELQHVKQRHHLKGYLKGIITTTVWNVTFGALTGAIVIDPTFIQQLALSKYNSLEEDEADRLAVEMLRSKKLPTSGGVSFFKRLEEKHKDNYLYKLSFSHPGNKKRMKTFASNDFLKNKIMSDDDWQELKKIAELKSKELSVSDLINNDSE